MIDNDRILTHMTGGHGAEVNCASESNPDMTSGRGPRPALIAVSVGRRALAPLAAAIVPHP